MPQNTYIIGNGNLGSHVSALFEQKGIAYNWLNVKLDLETANLKPEDVVWLCIPDAAIPEIIEKLRVFNALLIYCSGNLEMEDHWKSHVAVWYPLYSFRKNVNILWSEIPVFIEAYNDKAHTYFVNLSGKLNKSFEFCDSKRRRNLHLAAVFVNNFTNAMLVAAENTLQDFSRDEILNALLPIAQQTIARWSVSPAAALQTGPAMRKDIPTLQRHLEELHDFPLEKHLYEVISNYIQQKIRQN